MPHQHHLDGVQSSLALLCLAELSVFLSYLFSVEIAGEKMISDTLATVQGYSVVLTVFYSLRVTAAVLFFYRYRQGYPRTAVSGMLLLCMGLFGWAWLVLHDSRTSLLNHVVGVAIFCFASVGAPVLLLLLAKRSDPHLSQLHDRLAVYLLIVAVLLGITYMEMWAVGDTKSYIPEHLAYISHLLFYMVFFLYHTPNVLARVDAYCAEGYPDLQAARPLLVVIPASVEMSESIRV